MREGAVTPIIKEIEHQERRERFTPEMTRRTHPRGARMYQGTADRGRYPNWLHWVAGIVITLLAVAVAWMYYIALTWGN